MLHPEDFSYMKMVRSGTCGQAHDPSETITEFVSPSTGGTPPQAFKTASLPAGRLITQRIGDYEVSIVVDQDGKYVDIAGVSLKRDFMSLNQRIAASGYIDVEEFYPE